MREDHGTPRPGGFHAFLEDEAQGSYDRKHNPPSASSPSSPRHLRRCRHCGTAGCVRRSVAISDAHAVRRRDGIDRARDLFGACGLPKGPSSETRLHAYVCEDACNDSEKFCRRRRCCTSAAGLSEDGPGRLSLLSCVPSVISRTRARAGRLGSSTARGAGQPEKRWP